MKPIAAALMTLIAALAVFASEETKISYSGPGDARAYAVCDAGLALTAAERQALLVRLAGTRTGRAVLSDFAQLYGSFEKLLIQWDGVSYSQVVGPAAEPARAPAGLAGAGALARTPGSSVCVHLTRRLPDIEHLADLAHELAHATRLSAAVLRGDVASEGEFVRARLTSRGGEADAFSVECRVKNEVLGRWDELCSPYASAETFDVGRVVRDLYSGRLSASLTGETYPVMLARQFKAMLAKRGRLQYASGP